MDMFKRNSVAVTDIKQSIKAPKPRESVLPDNLINMQNEKLEPTKPENMFIKQGTMKARGFAPIVKESAIVEDNASEMTSQKS